MNDDVFCPQCGGKTKLAPKLVYWHLNCTRCRRAWQIDSDGNWESVNSPKREKHTKKMVKMAQEVYGKRTK